MGKETKPGSHHESGSLIAKTMSKIAKKVFVLDFKKWYNKTDYNYKCKWVIETFLGGLIDEE